LKGNMMILKKSRAKTISFLITISVILFLLFSHCVRKEPMPWSFGVMGDTQWTPYGFSEGKLIRGYDPEGTNPDSVSTSIITQINREFIDKGVKFVIQVGDITDWGTDKAIASRAAAARELYDAGIGFFCMRGNHEVYNYTFTPEFAPNDYGIPAMQSNFPQHQGTGKNVFGANNFSSPGSDKPGLGNMATELKGISYAFDFGEEGNNATFVIIDPWATQTQATSNNGLYVSYGYPIGAQQDWISSRLNLESRGTIHAFVFSHQPLIACNHVDSPFGFLDSAIDDQNTFYAELVKNKVGYYISGHDHIHSRSMVTSPDGKNSVEQLICAPACPKFYKPRPDDFPGWHGQKYRSKMISQELNNIGYYIFTIDGPKVTVDYYSDKNGGFIGGKDWPDGKGSLITPKFNFVKKESWSYSLNSQAYLMKQGDTDTTVKDSYKGTTQYY
jgi:hypothetical protein